MLLSLADLLGLSVQQQQVRGDRTDSSGKLLRELFVGTCWDQLWALGVLALE